MKKLPTSTITPANHTAVANRTGVETRTGVNPKLDKVASPLLRSHSTAAAKVSLAAIDTSQEDSHSKLMKVLSHVLRRMLQVKVSRQHASLTPCATVPMC